MKTVSLEELLEAGCHFGHQVSRQNPKAKEYIFEARDNIHIIDLEKTKEGLEEAAQYIKDVAKKGGSLLVVGTKRQAQEVLKDELNRVKKDEETDIFFVDKRWIGGTLTNATEVSKNFRKLNDLKKLLANQYDRAKYTKKELSDWDKDRQKLESFYGGIIGMSKTPDVMFIIDTHLEHVAVDESRRQGVPIVGITDTNADPTLVDYPIPANDDAVGSLKLIISYILDAWLEGKKGAAKAKADEEEAAAKASAAKEKAEAKAASDSVESKKKEDASSNTAVKKEEKKPKATVKKAPDEKKSSATKNSKSKAASSK